MANNKINQEFKDSKDVQIFVFTAGYMKYFMQSLCLAALRKKKGRGWAIRISSNSGANTSSSRLSVLQPALGEAQEATASQRKEE